MATEQDMARIDAEIAKADGMFRAELSHPGGSWSKAQELGLYLADWVAEREKLLQSLRPVDAREAATVAYLRQNLEPGDRLAVVLINQQRQHSVQRITTVDRLTAPDVQRWLRAMNVDGYSVYAHLQALKPAAQGRTRADIDQIRTVFLDLDHGGRAAVEQLRASRDVPRPNWILETSPGRFQAVWRVEGLTLPQAERLTKGLAERFGGDPQATPPTQPSRLPGFANKKYPDLHWVAAERGKIAPSRAESFPERLTAPEPPPRAQERPRAAVMRENGHSMHRVAPDILVRRALERAGAGRNRAAFDLACQFRDNRYSEAEAGRFMRAEFLPRLPDADTSGRHQPYTEREMVASLRSAYHQPAREPWPERELIRR